ncbi:hypothetical protein ACSBR2_001781 [Camellia fascicularis]
MLGIEAIPSVFLAVGVLAMPQSPQWLVLQGRLGDAKRVLEKISKSKEEAQLRLNNIKEATGIPEECNSTTTSFRCFAVVAVKTSGRSSWSTRLQPRLLLTSMGGMIVSLACLGMSLTMIDHSEKELIWAVVLSVSSILAFVAMFFMEMGPIPTVYNSEIFPLRLRAQGVSFGVAINHLISLCLGSGLAFWLFGYFSLGLKSLRLSGVMSMTFISLYKAITIGEAFFLFMGVAMLGWLFFYEPIPETQGKTLEKMQMLFGTFFKWRSTMRELKKNKERVRSTDDR